MLVLAYIQFLIRLITVKDSFPRTLFAPVLNLFEGGEGEYHYKPSHRTILTVVGVLLGSLALAAIALGIYVDMLAMLLPGGVFLLVGIVCLIVATLGSDRAVARIWSSR